ncbi:MAG TPA: PAS domain-containing protein [Candidatus Acidoferrum sp.]|nr:PAS domain-containing protein [Candidatus Acidoferrum sp.]
MFSDRLAALFRSWTWRALCVATGLLIFTSDALTPPGYAHSTLYLLLLLMAAATRDNKFIILMTAYIILLAIAGAVLGPIQSIPLLIANRSTSVVEMMLMAWACIVMNRQFSSMRPAGEETAAAPTAQHARTNGKPVPPLLFTEHMYSFQQIADKLPQIVWVASPRGEVFYSNRMLGKYAGIKQEDLYPRSSWGSTVSPQDLPHCEAEWLKSVREGSEFSVETRIRRHDGTYRWHLVQAHPVHDDRGQITMWCGSAVDIHDLKTRLEELQQHQGGAARTG